MKVNLRLFWWSCYLYWWYIRYWVRLRVIIISSFHFRKIAALSMAEPCLSQADQLWVTQLSGALRRRILHCFLTSIDCYDGSCAFWARIFVGAAPYSWLHSWRQQPNLRLIKTFYEMKRISLYLLMPTSLFCHDIDNVIVLQSSLHTNSC